MNKQEKLIKEMVPYMWYLFKIYLNDPNYFVKQEDRLIKVFMNKNQVKLFHR